MEEVFRRFYEDIGRNMDDELPLQTIDPVFRAFFESGEKVDLPHNPDALEAWFESIESGAGLRLRSYLAEAQIKYEKALEHVLYCDFRKADWWKPMLKEKSFLGAKLLGSLEGW